MPSDEFYEDLSRWIDGELPPERHAQVTAHLKSCTTCRETLREFTQLSAVLRGMAVSDAPAYVTDNAMRSRQLLHDTFYPVLATRDERDVRAAIQQFVDEGQAKPGSAAGNSNSTMGERVERLAVCRVGRRRNRVDSFVMDIHESSFCRKGVAI